MSDGPHGLLRWALDWAWVGAATSALAPVPAWALTGAVPDDFLLAAAALGAGSGLLVGGLLWAMHRAVPERNRVAVLGVLTPLPLGAWGASVAALAALCTTPKMAGLAFFLGSFSALPQMLWLVPAYTASVRRGWQLAPTLLATLLAPVTGFVGMMGFFALMDAF